MIYCEVKLDKYTSFILLYVLGVMKGSLKMDKYQKVDEMVPSTDEV
jgi:hypothetical protein